MAGGIFHRPDIGHIRARNYGDNQVLTLFYIGFGDAKNHFVLVNAKFRGFPHRQENGMLVIFRTNAVDHAVGFEDIFLTKDFFCVFMLAVGAKDLACDGLAVFFGIAAGGGIHARLCLNSLGACHSRGELH